MAYSVASVANCASSVLAFNALIDELLAVNRDRHSFEPAGPELAVEAGNAICFSIGRPVEVWAALIRSACGLDIRPGLSWRGLRPDQSLDLIFPSTTDCHKFQRQARGQSPVLGICATHLEIAQFGAISSKANDLTFTTQVKNQTGETVACLK